MTAYLILFASALLAATILPLSSEAVLVSLAIGGKSPLALWTVASIGNTLGAMINWLLGRYLMRFRNRAWFPFQPSDISRAQDWYRRYGVWSLLFAWLPLVGDALTLIAGILGARWWWVALLAGIGKAARYAVIIGVARAALPG